MAARLSRVVFLAASRLFLTPGHAYPSRLKRLNLMYLRRTEVASGNSTTACLTPSPNYFAGHIPNRHHTSRHKQDNGPNVAPPRVTRAAPLAVSSVLVPQSAIRLPCRLCATARARKSENPERV